MVLTDISKLQVTRTLLLNIWTKSLARTSRQLTRGDILCHRCNQRRSVSENSQQKIPEWNKLFNLKEPKLNWKYLSDPENIETIHQNIINRKGVGNIHNVVQLWNDYQRQTDPSEKESAWKKLLESARDIPNKSHPESPIGSEENAEVLRLVGTKQEFDFKPKTVVELGEKLGMLRTEYVSMTTGERTYYFKHDLARLEQALIQYTIEKLRQKGFQLVSVPDMIHPDIIESCGFNTSGERTQVYRLDAEKHGDICLAGTSEMPLAGYFMNEELEQSELPMKLTAVSRCYRAETSELQEEKGIYRVHQFTKVEMFGVTPDGPDSDQLMDTLLDIQLELFSGLGLHFRVLDMPSQELGAPAYRKYDIEAWMPAKQFWDFQHI